MPDMFEIEAQVKALAPVFTRLLAGVKEELTKDFQQQINIRDQQIEQLKKEVANKHSIEEIAQLATKHIQPGEPGKDADMEVLKQHLEQLVKAIPAPQDGKSVTAEEVQPMLQQLVQDAVKDLPEPPAGKDADMEVLKQHLEQLVKAIPAPQDGKSVTIEEVQPMLQQMVQDAVKALPAAPAGKDADMEALKQHIEQLIKAIPVPQDGKSVTAEEVLPEIKNHVDAYLKTIPAPKAGEPGKDAVAPTAEEIANTFERRFSDLSLSWERQARDLAVKAVESMPKAKDGRDALPLDSFDLNLSEDGRTVTVKMQAGDTVLEKSVKIPAIIDKGVYSTKGAYEQGDGVSYAGCFWIAKCDDPKGVPGSGETDWRCAVKRGRDGKDLRDSAKTVDTSKGVSVRSGDAK